MALDGVTRTVTGSAPPSNPQPEAEPDTSWREEEPEPAPPSLKAVAVYCPDCDLWLEELTQWEDHKIGKNHNKKNKRNTTPDAIPPSERRRLRDQRLDAAREQLLGAATSSQPLARDEDVYSDDSWSMVAEVELIDP